MCIQIKENTKKPENVYLFLGCPLINLVHTEVSSGTVTKLSCKYTDRVSFNNIQSLVKTLYKLQVNNFSF